MCQNFKEKRKRGKRSEAEDSKPQHGYHTRANIHDASPALFNEAERTPLGCEPRSPTKKRKRVFSPEEKREPKRRRCLSPIHQPEVELKGQTERKAAPQKKTEACHSNISDKHLRHEQVQSLGFPNIGQTCYMNSCLQSLLTLDDFVDDIKRQKKVWRSNPDAGVMRYLTKIKKARPTKDLAKKTLLLTNFKTALSAWNPEFKDKKQKDAHEFLSSVLQQIRSLDPQLQNLAATMDQTYTCPVEKHIAFTIENTRTCKSCGVGATRLEKYTDLSLDIALGGGTVEDMLQDYLKETDLEYSCECGANMSSQRSSFATMPKALVLHLKRIRYDSSYQLEKVRDPVDLLRELVIPSKEGGSCYSLVSAISHIGTGAGSGHYISDGVDLDVPVEDPEDRWFTYNDTVVRETSGASVCNLRKQNAYVLVYKRQDQSAG
ncbi:ubiquitin carboxyl-terminal hydrolase 37-like [Notolabrus celidotus]|uniref:ubiquitin carboxyl-terminal hydrolase 37-like n=1 Tax=Notolabrus celidotus TaxID=1203425 RepID=UPI00148FD95D|nr:ubiquitin carboxyl-terminal hydrolase 37-like [Notolabrus celidotus]